MNTLNTTTTLDSTSQAETQEPRERSRALKARLNDVRRSHPASLGGFVKNRIAEGHEIVPLLTAIESERLAGDIALGNRLAAQFLAERQAREQREHRAELARQEIIETGIRLVDLAAECGTNRNNAITACRFAKITLVKGGHRYFMSQEDAAFLRRILTGGEKYLTVRQWQTKGRQVVEGARPLQIRNPFGNRHEYYGEADTLPIGGWQQPRHRLRRRSKVKTGVELSCWRTEGF